MEIQMSDILSKTTLGFAFPADPATKQPVSFSLEGPLANIVLSGKKPFGVKSPFRNAGIIIDRTVYTQQFRPAFYGLKTTLSDVLINERDVPSDFFVDGFEIDKWVKKRAGWSKDSLNPKTGERYPYSVGSARFPDDITKPARTIITTEGERSASRFTHIIPASGGRYRRLTPVELERLNMFPDDHTNEASDVKRGFLMGNDLVVGVVEKIGSQLAACIAKQ